METTEASESIPCETKEDGVSFVVGSLVKQEDQEEDDREQDPVEVLKEENKVEDKFFAEVVEKDYENNVKATERSIEVASKGEANQQILPEETKTEPEDKLENVLHALPEETETGLATEDATNITSMEEEGTIQKREETSETETKGEKAETTDNTKDSEKEV